MRKKIYWKEHFAKKGEKEIVAAIAKKYYSKNREVILEKKREYYEKNKERLREKARINIATKRALAKLLIIESVKDIKNQSEETNGKTTNTEETGS